MLNIVIPMAGAGSRFAKAGYVLPKPLIPVNGVPMIRLVIENLRPDVTHRFIFIAQQAHIDTFGLLEKLESWAPGCLVVPQTTPPAGAACSVLLARPYIETDEPLMIANSDQYVDISIDDYLASMGLHDGLIMTMPADDPKWSYVGFDEKGHVARVVEKQVISNEATVGIYNFRRGRDFVQGALKMIEQDLRVNGEFYVAPVYDQVIAAGNSVTTRNIEDAMHGIGIPADLDAFLATELCTRVTRGLA